RRLRNWRSDAMRPSSSVCSAIVSDMDVSPLAGDGDGGFDKRAHLSHFESVGNFGRDGAKDRIGCDVRAQIADAGVARAQPMRLRSCADGFEELAGPLAA